VIVAFIESAAGARRVEIFDDAEKAVLTVGAGRYKNAQISGFRDRDDPDLQDRLARFNAGEELPIRKRDGNSTFTVVEDRA
jgi:hypothetical protein